MNKIAIDIGETKTEICVFSKNYNLVKTRIFKTADLNPGGLKFITRIKDLIKKYLPQKTTQIGIAWNGAIYDGKIIYSSLLGDESYNIREDFKQEFKIPVNVENDANAMALAESRFGLGRKTESFVLMNLGMGSRLSFVNQGRLIRGYSGNLGEVSQLKMPSSFRKEKVVPMDYYLSGKSITRIYRNLAGGTETAGDAFFSSEDNLISIEANRIFRRRFVRALQMISYFYNPELVVLNGPLKEIKDKYIKKVLLRYRAKTMPFFHFRDLKISKLDHAACLGSLIKKNISQKPKTS